MQNLSAQEPPASIWKIRGKALMAVIMALPVGGAWILASSAYVEFQIGWAIAYGLFVLSLFIFFHGFYAYRRNFRSARYMRVPAAKMFGYGTLAAVTLLACAVFSLLASDPSDPNKVITDHDIYVLPILAVLLFPVVEEFVFRAWIQGNLEQVVGVEVALLLSAAVFATVHGSDNFTKHFISGLVYGAAFILSRNIWVPIFVHALHNLGVTMLDASSAATELAEAIIKSPPSWISIVSVMAQAIIALVAAMLVVQFRRRQMLQEG